MGKLKSHPLLASELLAFVNNSECSGPDECYWCTAPCERTVRHDQPPHLPFVRIPKGIKRPGNAYICKGCQIWQRSRITINFLGGGYKDRQSLRDYSFVITEANIWAINHITSDLQHLLKFLQNPPLTFCLALIDPKFTNSLAMAEANDFKEIQGETPLVFTYNNTVQTYTVYEFKEGLKTGSQGKMPGVQTLLTFLGPLGLKPQLPEPTTPKRPGPPPKSPNETRKIVQSEISLPVKHSVPSV